MLSTIIMSMGQFTIITENSFTMLISTTDVDDDIVCHTCARAILIFLAGK